MSTKPLGSAILSLLVAADQRGPAIIGGAHLLYYARFNAGHDETAKAFAQLKRDATDLMAAVNAVEAAMAATKAPCEACSHCGAVTPEEILLRCTVSGAALVHGAPCHGEAP